MKLRDKERIDEVLEVFMVMSCKVILLTILMINIPEENDNVKLMNQIDD